MFINIWGKLEKKKENKMSLKPKAIKIREVDIKCYICNSSGECKKPDKNGNCPVDNNLMKIK